MRKNVDDNFTCVIGLNLGIFKMKMYPDITGAKDYS